MFRSRIVPVLVAALVVVGGLNLVAYAANGRPLLLGQHNRETTSTSLRNTGAGPALRLRSREAAPPLAVSSTKKVARLNADRIDGLDGRQLGVRLRTYLIGGDGDENDVVKTFPGLPTGRYWVGYEFRATYNAGLTCWVENGTGEQFLVTSSPDDGTVLSAEGLVDADTGVVMRCVAGGIFDSGSIPDSQIRFVALTSSTVAEAVTSSLPERR
jgi:hypothetical protein